LIGLTYSDWSIVHPDSYLVENGKYKVKKYDKLSGPFTAVQKQNSHTTITSQALLKNKFYPLHEKVIFDSGTISTYSKCEELFSQIDSIATFRMYRDELTEACKNIFKEHGFEVFNEQPSWIVKADFSQAAMSKLSPKLRMSLIHAIQNKLKNDYKKIGNVRATGIRAPYLYGSLTEIEFDNLLANTPNDFQQLQKLKISIVVMDLWSNWASYKWLVSTLKDLNIQVSETVLSISDFYSQFASGKIHTDYDLQFIPLGVGDVDPDGAWRIASRYFYSDIISKEMLQKAYLEPVIEKRGENYKSFAKLLISQGRYIPIVMNSDVIGIHKSYTTKKGAALRNGTSFFDLE